MKKSFSGFILIFGLLIYSLTMVLNAAGQPLTPPANIDGAYDKSQWEWQIQIDGRYLLAHKRIAKCWVATDWPMEITNEDEEAPEKTNYYKAKFGNVVYNVTEVYNGKKLKEVRYSMEGVTFQLVVFGSKGCRVEAEKILPFVKKPTNSK